MTSLIREEGTPIYNLQIGNFYNSVFLTQKYKELLKDKDIYVVTSKFYRYPQKTIKELEENNFEIIEEYAKYNYNELPYLHYLDEWIIYKVRYKAEAN